MIKEEKMFLGGMDKENSPETVNRVDYLDAHNIRTVGNGQNDTNYLSNLEGTVKVTTNIPSGQNKSIGSKGFETASKAYIIRYNSQGKHQIVEFDYNLSLETVIFENMTDTSDIDILGWTTETFFSDIRLMHDKFLILNNSEGYPLFINVDEFKQKRGSRVLTKEDLVLPKIPPSNPIKALYLSDPTKTTNSLRGNLFQFRYNFEYSDFRSSSWSTVSKREVPINEPSEGNGQNVSSNNAILLKLDLSQRAIEKANIIVRIGLGNWLRINSVELSRIQNLPNTEIPYDEDTGELTNPDIQEAYNPVTKEYQVLFYNEGLYPIEDQVEVENPYDAIPLKAETVEVINGNVLALGGLTEGYDRPVLEATDGEKIGVEVSYYNPNLTSNIETKPNFDVARMEVTEHGGITKTIRWYIKFNDVPPRAGDRIVLEVKRPTDVVTKKLSYTVTSSDALSGRTVTLRNAVNAMIPQLPDGTTSLRTDGTDGIMYKAEAFAQAIYGITARYVVYANTSSYSTQSINTLKNGATYQVAVAYEDEYGKYFPIVTDQRFTARMDSLASTQGLLPEINWMLPTQAPEGAVRYNILLSENQTYQNYITLTGAKVDGLGDSEYLVISLDSLSRFNESEKDSQVTYDFTKGDKVTFIRTIDSSGNTVDWFRYPFIELDIVDFKIEVIEDPDDPNLKTAKYLLTVRNTPLISEYNLEDKEIVLELYTPKAKAISQESTLLFEIGESYKVINGEHEVTSGVVRQGDSYYKGRLFRSSLDVNVSHLIEVADPNFSDNYISNFWSAGRARLYDDQVGRVERKASIRYSDEYTVGSKYNGINRFYLERVYGENGGETTSKYGAIKKLEMRDNAVVCIQEMKVGIIPVARTVVNTATDQSLILDSTKLFGSIQYRVGNYGCGTAKESVAVSRDGLIYFFDNNNCLPLRDSMSNLDVIDINMTTYFINYMKQAQLKGAKFIGYFDNINREYNLTIEEKGGVLSTLVFNEVDITYKDPLTSVYVINQPANGSVIQNGNNLTYTPYTDFVGVDNITISVYGTIKNIPITVTSGTTTPQQFIFIDKVNQQPSTLIESNSISVDGINTSTTISIVGGEYQVNGGVWTTASGLVSNNDFVKVRVLTSASNSTTVSATLTIGGYSDTFSVTTISSTVPPSEFLDVKGTLEHVGAGNYNVTATLSHALDVDYTIQGLAEYTKFGGTQYAPFTVVFFAGETSKTVSTIFTNPDGGQNGYLFINTSTPFVNGEVVECADNVERVLRITEDLTIIT